MWLASQVVVVVPAWNEAPRIERVLRGLPAWIDRVVIVDDASADGTAEAAVAVGDPRISIVRHSNNRGVGAAIATGYRSALSMGGAARDAFVIMAGDGQMDPDDLPALVDPLAAGRADYVKGTRFPRGPRGRPRGMPPARWLGGLAFSVATSVAVGIRVSDSQCGYAAISREACVALDLDALWPRYGYPNDLLSQLALRGMRIAEAPVRAVYADEVSRLKVRHVPVIAAIVARAGWRRLGTAVPKTSPPPRSDPSRLTAAPQVPARGSRVHAPARDRD